MTMIDAARESGAEVREGFHISELTRDENGRVTGLVGKGADGVEVTEEAKVVIGADGRNSFLAKEVDAEEYDVRPLNTCGGYTYMEGVPHDGADLHLRNKRMFFLFPTDNGQVCVGTVTLFTIRNRRPGPAAMSTPTSIGCMRVGNGNSRSAGGRPAAVA